MVSTFVRKLNLGDFNENSSYWQDSSKEVHFFIKRLFDRVVMVKRAVLI